MSQHLDVFPLHPQPLELESYTGYLTRLADANGIHRLNSLCVLTGLHLSQERTPSDFPHLLAYVRLPVVAACSVERLHATTFYALLRKFGRTTSAPHGSKQFLKESLGTHLRYCPQCLEDSGYVSLLWRFRQIQACPRHETMLLERCGHCEACVPFLSNGLYFAGCPTCRGDLRRCVAEQAPESIVSESQRWAEDLAFLLSPQAWDALNIVQHVGPQLLRLRQQSSTLDAVAQRLHIPAHTVQGMESQVRGRKGEHFAHYLSYSHLLGVRLKDLFTQAVATYHTAAADRWIVLDVRESTLLRRLNETVEHLAGRFPALTWFAEQLGVSAGRLKQYPAIDARVKQLQDEHRRQQKSLYEQQLAATRQAAEEQAAAGQPVTRKTLCDQTGVNPNWFGNRVEFAALLRSYDNQRTVCRQTRQRDIDTRIEAAIHSLKEGGRRVTIRAIADLVGLHEASLRMRPSLNSLLGNLETHGPRDRLKRDQEDDALIRQLPAIETQLVTAGQTVTQQAVCRLLGLSPSKARSYPRLNEWLRQIPLKRQHQRLEHDARMCQQWPSVLEILRQTGTAVTLARIGQQFQCSPAMLRRFPRTWVLISDALRQQESSRKRFFQQLEKDYLTRIDAILSDLRQSGQPVSAKRICDHLGIPLANLRHFFRVRARLEQIAEDTRRQNR